MKLAIMSHYWNSPEGGGVNTHLKGLVKALKDAEPNLNIKLIFIVGQDDNEIQIPNRRIGAIIKACFALNKIQPDIINVRESRILLYGAILYSIFNNKVKVIYTFHTDPGAGYKGKKIFFNWALNRCDYVAFIANGLERKVTENYKLKIKTKKCITHPGVTTLKVSDVEKTDFIHKFHLKKGPIILLQGFTATRQKKEGAIMLLQSFKRIKSKYKDATLIITRMGAYSETLKQYTKELGLCDVIFTGTLENSFIPLEICDVFVWPWLGEMGGGMALLEALHLAKPIVATTASGRLEPLTEDNAYLVKPDAESLANGVVKLLEDRVMAVKLGVGARKTALEKYTWEISAARHLELYGVK